jgi:hypothetical protein
MWAARPSATRMDWARHQAPPGPVSAVPAPHIEYLKGGYTMRRFAHYRGHFNRGRGYRGYGYNRNRRYGR